MWHNVFKAVCDQSFIWNQLFQAFRGEICLVLGFLLEKSNFKCFLQQNQTWRPLSWVYTGCFNWAVQPSDATSKKVLPKNMIWGKFHIQRAIWQYSKCRNLQVEAVATDCICCVEVANVNHLSLNSFKYKLSKSLIPLLATNFF